MAKPPANILYYGDNLDILRRYVHDESVEDESRGHMSNVLRFRRGVGEMTPPNESSRRRRCQ